MRVVGLVILVGIEAVEAHHVVDVATVQHVENRHHAHFLDGAALEEGVGVGAREDAVSVVSRLPEQLFGYRGEFAVVHAQLHFTLPLGANDQTVVQNQNLLAHFSRKNGVHEEEKASQSGDQLEDVRLHLSLREDRFNYAWQLGTATHTLHRNSDLYRFGSKGC